MGILNIQPSERMEAPVLIALAGTTGSGKTKTALEIALGMVDSPSEIGFLCTENHRGSLYSDTWKEERPKDYKFKLANFYAPFSPKRFAEAIKEFEEEGVKVLIIDTISHEWNGIGGCEDIAEQAVLNGKKMKDWIKAKSEHKRYFMRSLLYSKIHIICCVRAAEKTDFSDATKPKSLGIKPQQEKNFMFEMLVSMMLSKQGKVQEYIKDQHELREAFLPNEKGYLGRHTGKAIIDWVKNGKKQSEAFIDARQKCFDSAEKGIEKFRQDWIEITKNLSSEDKENLLKMKDQFKDIADAYDEQAKEEKEDDSSKVLTKAEIEANRLIALIKGCTTTEQLQKLKEDSDLDKSTTLPKSVHVSYFEKFEELSK